MSPWGDPRLAGDTVGDGQDVATPCHRGLPCATAGLPCVGTLPVLPAARQNPPEDKTLPWFGQFFRLSPKLGRWHSMGEAGLALLQPTGRAGPGRVPCSGILGLARELSRQKGIPGAPCQRRVKPLGATSVGASPPVTGLRRGAEFWEGAAHIPCAPKAGSRLEFGVRGAPRSSEPAPRPGCTSGPGAQQQSQPVNFPRALPQPGWESCGSRSHPRMAGQGHQLSPEPPGTGTGLGDTPQDSWVQRPEPQRPPKAFWKSKFGWSGMRIFLPRATPRILAPGDNAHRAPI